MRIDTNTPTTGVRKIPVLRRLAPPVPAEPPVERISSQEASQWLQALGGRDNLLSLESVALTRLRVALKSGQQLQQKQLTELGCQGVSQVAEGVYHLLVGPRAGALGQSLGALPG